VVLQQLETIRQKETEPFHSFIVRFEALLFKTGGLHWNDEMGPGFVKLNQSIHEIIRTHSVGRGVYRNDYARAVESYQEIATDLETLCLARRYQHPRVLPGAGAGNQNRARCCTLSQSLNFNLSISTIRSQQS
jgi:hypothetical protein